MGVKLKMKKEFRAIVVLVGTTIGAGMFGIPYVVSKIGFLAGMAYLLVLGVLVLFLNLIYGEVILRTPGDHQLIGYVKIYLGKKKRFLNAFCILSLFISLYGALLAYLIKIGEFLSLILGGNAVFFSLVFFILASLAIYFGLRTVSWSELVIVSLLLTLAVLTSILSLGKVQMSNFSGFNLAHFFLPYGVILFALSSSSVIPEMEEVLRKKPGKLKNSIIIGSLIPIFVYLLFVFSVVGTSGLLTSDDAISGLLLFLPDYVIGVGAVMGILAMGSSFLTLGYVLKESWLRDFKTPKNLAFILACLPALVLFLLGARKFIAVLDFTGAVSGGISGILILAMFEKAKKMGKREPAYSLKVPKFLPYLLYLIFFLGMFSPFLSKF